LLVASGWLLDAMNGSLTRDGNTPMAAPDQLATVYATDENIAIRASGDFSMLCPDWQKLAHAADGVFAAGLPWVLTSASVDFADAGVTAQHVVLLRKPNTVFKGGGELLAIDSATHNGIVLRRLGTSLNLGQPPAPTVGLTGVEFLIATLDPQIEEATFDLNRRFSIDPNIAGRMSGDVYDLRDLRQACVLTVLAQRYAAETRGSEGDFALKLTQVKQELAEVLARLQIRWGPSGTNAQSTNWFSTRIVR
jgi:hypothetical protein